MQTPANSDARGVQRTKFRRGMRQVSSSSVASLRTVLWLRIVTRW